MPDDRSRGRRKSRFMETDSVPAGYYQDVFAQGSNLKISYDNYLDGLGVTGTINQAGNPAGTPVLDPQGTDNYIRNIEDGSGIITGISAENGIVIEHGFTQDSGGLPIVNDINDPSPTFVSLFEGPGIGLSVDGDSITITATGDPIPTTKVVSVNSESDFPSAIGGVITLEADTVYSMANNVTTANRFVFSANSSLVGVSPIVALLTYTGAGDMFTGVDVNTFVDNLYISAPTASRVFNFSDTIGGVYSFRVSTTVILDCVKIGLFDNLLSTALRGMTVVSASDGVTISGSDISIVSTERLQITTSSATLVGIDLGASVSRTIEIENLLVTGVVGTVGLSGAANGANLIPGSVATLSSCNFVGGVTPEVGIDPANSIRWQSTGNDGISDTRPDSLISMVSNLVETVILLTDVPVKVAGVWSIESESMFQSDATGRITYIGERDLRVPIDFSTTLLAASGGDKQATIYMAVNGVVIPQTAKQGTINSSKAVAVSTIWQASLSTGDYIELFVEINGAVTVVNVICSDAVGRIN